MYIRFTSFAVLANDLVGYIKLLVPLVFMLCFVAFFWNGGRFIFGSGSDAKDAGERKNWITYGVIALFVAAALGGFVALLQGFFLTGSSSLNTPPDSRLNPIPVKTFPKS